MNTKIKIICTCGVIGLFLFFAMASIGPDESTNTTVNITDCEEMPAVTNPLQVIIEVKRGGAGGEYINGAFGKIFITHQKVINNDECTYAIDFQETIDFICDSQGKFVYTGENFTHDNKEDLFRVEVELDHNLIDDYFGSRETQVLKYNSAEFNFLFIVYYAL